jgi:ubiquinol-cytochrome c reductase cytochrome c subunit
MKPMRAVCLLLASLGTACTTGTAVPALEAPAAGDPDVGRQVYLAGCATCHGDEAQGIDGLGPPLAGVGAASVHFQLSSGRMPAANAEGQTQRRPPAFDEATIAALTAYIASLGDGPPIPEVRIDEAELPRGEELFIANCAPCHGATANGGATGGGWIAPALHDVPDLNVAEAIVTGPGQMPAFAFDAGELDAVATYVAYLRRAPDPGGFEIGGIGPVPEGLVAWAFGITALVLVAYLIGREWTMRDTRSDEEPHA